MAMCAAQDQQHDSLQGRSLTWYGADQVLVTQEDSESGLLGRNLPGTKGPFPGRLVALRFSTFAWTLLPLTGLLIFLD